ncbi:F-box protein At5g49610-like [Lycium ferocissimum]|uniref:F-box protein At5g49610-like n=1 Tax=Lycium ferocissimum TaxID=112874 RepID=UPI0028166644|nr:F-box protein At5g49610-like [Lycium ferocissimum]
MDAKSSKVLDVPITVANPIPSSKPSQGDCKGTRISQVTIMDLPRVIMVEILSRLPIKPIFRCKTICKLWYHLFSNPLFVNMYHSRLPFPCILLSTQDDSVTSLLELKADYDYHSLPCNRPIELSPKFHLPPLKSKMFLIGSCNGLICLLNGSTYDENHSVYINNPLLGEYFKLKVPEWDKRDHHVAYGF